MRPETIGCRRGRVVGRVACLRLALPCEPRRLHKICYSCDYRLYRSTAQLSRGVPLFAGHSARHAIPKSALDVVQKCAVPTHRSGTGGERGARVAKTRNCGAGIRCNSMSTAHPTRTHHLQVCIQFFIPRPLPSPTPIPFTRNITSDILSHSHTFGQHLGYVRGLLLDRRGVPF